MSEVNFTATQTGDNNYILYIDSTSAEFYVYLDGLLYSVTNEKEITVDFGSGTYPVVDVFDTPEDTPEYAAPATVNINFDTDPTAEKYKIEYLTDDEWLVEAEIDTRGISNISYISDILEDETAHEFRIAPIGENGAIGEYSYFSFDMCRYPDIPSFNITNDSTSWEIVNG